MDTRFFTNFTKTFSFSIFFFLFFGILSFGQTKIEITEFGTFSDVAPAGVAKTTFLAGEKVVYRLKYSVSSLTGSATGGKIDVAFGSNIYAAQGTFTQTSDIASKAFNSTTNTLTYNFTDPVAAGSTGILELTAYTKNGSVPNGQTTTTTATSAVTNPGGLPSTKSATTTSTAQRMACPSLSLLSGGVPSYPTAYRLYLGPDVTGVYTANYGVLNLSNVTVTQQLLAGTVFGSAKGRGYNVVSGLYEDYTGTYNSGTNTVTWTIPANHIALQSYGNGFYQNMDVLDLIVTYPSGTFPIGTNVTVNTTVTATPLGGTPVTISHGTPNQPSTCNATLNVATTLAAATLTASTSKTGASSTILPNVSEAYGYNLSFRNTSNVPLQNLVIEDVLPSNVPMWYSQFQAYPFYDTNNARANVYYKTDLDPTWKLWSYSPLPNALVYSFIPNPTAYGYNVPLATNEHVTGIRYVFLDDFPANASAPYWYIYMGTGAVTSNTPVINCLNVTTTTPVPAAQLSSCNTRTFVPVSSNTMLFGSKYSGGETWYYQDYGTPYNIGDNTWIKMEYFASASGAAAQNPVLMDLLPLGIEYDGWYQQNKDSWYVTNYQLDITDLTSFEAIPNYQGTGRTLIRVKWNGYTLPAGKRFYVNVKTKITNLAATSNQNTIYTTSTNTKTCTDYGYTGATRDSLDLNGNGNTTEEICFNRNHTINVNSSASLSSIKWVKGELDAAYSKYPDYGQTMQGGLANYKLFVKNTGNVPTNNVQVLDILPRVGDIGVKTFASPRLTDWRPNLATPVAAPAGIIVYYTTETNPCREDFISSTASLPGAVPAGCVTAVWTTAPPTDLTTVNAMRFDFGDKVLNPGDEFALSWEMRAPVNAPTNNEIAWNSFAFKGERMDNHDKFAPAEPNKVGIKVSALVPGAYGNFVWLDTNKDGIQDVGEMGIDGVRVELYRDNGDGISDPLTDPLVDFTITGNGGLYLFPNLPPANYFAVFYPPAPYDTSPKDAGGSDVGDSDGLLGSINGTRITKTIVTTIDATEADLSWDQGLFPSDNAFLGNYVWFDENQNNMQDEPAANGVNGLQVWLYRDTNGNGIAEPDGADGLPIKKDTTANDIYGKSGYYNFDNLVPGNYFVKFILRTDDAFTPTTGTLGAATSDATDSDPNSSGVTAVTNLVAGEYDRTWDAGIIIPQNNLKIGNLVWLDADNDGIVDATETGINDITINLYKDRNNNGYPDIDEFVATTLTATIGGQTGIYLFEELVVGNYIVQIPNSNYNTILKNYVSSTGNDPSPDPDNDINNDDNGTDNATYGVISKPVTLTTAGEPTNDGDASNFSNLTIDFGFFPIPCPTFLTQSADVVICLGIAGANLSITTNQNSFTNIKFVKYTSDQIVTNTAPTATELVNLYGSGGTLLATVVPTGTSSPYTATYPFAASDFPNTGTTPKIYYVYALVSNDLDATCRPVKEFKVTVNPLPTFSLVFTDITCYGNNDGTITLTPLTGTAPFTYSKDNGVTFLNTTGIFTGLLPITYSPAVRDANGCVKKCTP